MTPYISKAISATRFPIILVGGNISGHYPAGGTNDPVGNVHNRRVPDLTTALQIQ